MLRAFVVLALLSACGQPARSTEARESGPPVLSNTAPPTPTPTPPPPAPRRVQSRGELEAWMAPLPKRGLFTAQLGLGGQERVVIDKDARTLAARVELNFQASPKPVAKQLSAAELDHLWKLAEEAWRVPPPDPPAMTDYRQVIVALDGDEVMFISVQARLKPEEPAAKLAAEMRRAAGYQ